MTAQQPLARVALRTEVLEHPPGHESEIRRCVCGALFCVHCQGQDGGDPAFCGACLTVYGREP